VRWNSWRAIDLLSAHPAAARRALVGELSRHGAAVAAAEATLARAVATRDDLLAQILGWADPAYTRDAMARHAGRSAEAVNALLESQQQLGPARTAQPPTGPPPPRSRLEHHEQWSRLPPRTRTPGPVSPYSPLIREAPLNPAADQSVGAGSRAAIVVIPETSIARRAGESSGVVILSPI
jgi:hypothetical protein